LSERPFEIFQPFPTTHWSQVARAGGESGTAQRRALGELLSRYLPALKAYLVRHMKIPSDRAEDLLQGFVSDKILEKRLVGRADEERGKFRTFLLTALRNYVLNVLEREGRKKRSPARLVSLDPGDRADQVALPDPPSDVFDVAWAKEVVAETVRGMEEHCRRSRREDVWRVFESRLLAPSLEGVEPMPYEDLVAALRLRSPSEAANLLVTGKRMFQRLLRRVVGEYVRDKADIEAEIQDLIEILSEASAEGASEPGT